jgi:hypothetical protein
MASRMFSWLVFDAYMEVQAFIGLEWMPNTHNPISNELKKKDEHKFMQNFYFKLQET